MLVADFNAAVTLGRSILALLKTGRRPLKIAVQQMIDLGGGTTNTEQRHLRDLCAHLGATHSVILLHTRKITTTELLKILESRQEELPVDVTC
ncbi:hypothetical protein Hsw_3973 [Hymenobacter swuensis DY53]|uniref:Uncharacterized protein n=2 Tax=Hymenobacter TaxID=89966 RepID=W8F3N8_9BACT|nr:hypothetical protein Hsw_3973 [Hymenobacter swuensis DY53]